MNEKQERVWKPTGRLVVSCDCGLHLLLQASGELVCPKDGFVYRIAQGRSGMELWSWRG